MSRRGKGGQGVGGAAQLMSSHRSASGAMPSRRSRASCLLMGVPLTGLDDDDGSDDVDPDFEKAYPKRQDPRDYLSKRTPEEVFDEFDADGSGKLDQDEFMAMLPALGIIVAYVVGCRRCRWHWQLNVSH